MASLSLHVQKKKIF
nr:photosystem I subunit VIII [Acer pubipetiolatum var. pingpienense]